MNLSKWNKEQWKDAGLAVVFTLVLFAIFSIIIYIFY